MSEENANSMASNNDDSNGGGYVRKISAQAETDEKPLGRVKDMQRFLMDFERKNKEEAQRHVYQPKKKAAAGPRPWEVKKMEQQEQKEEKVEEKVEEPAVEEEKVEEEPVVEEVVERKKQEEEQQQQNVEEDAADDEEEDDDDDEESALDDFASLITTEKKETSVVAPTVAADTAAAEAPASPSAASCSTSSLASSQYTRIISKQAEADERPIEPVSELKQWLMQSAPGTDKKNRTLAAAAAAERERAERKLINELSKRMAREEAVKTARSYLRHISDQAVCDELPLMHVSEAQNMLLEFERKNRERIEKHSVKHPNKKMSRTASADGEDTVEEEGASSVMKKMEEAAAAEQPEEEEPSTASGSESELEDSTVEISLASNGPADLDESAPLNLSIDGVSEKGDEEEVADDDDDDDGDDDSTEMEQPSIDDSAAVESKVEANDDKVDDILEEAVSTFSAVGGPGTVQKLEGISHQQAGLVITYDKSSRSLISESTGSVASSGAMDDTNMPGVAPTDVFRKRYPTDAYEEDVEEAQRPKKLQRGIDMLKCLACPNPVKAMLKDGATAGANMAKDAKDAMKKVQANLTGNLTMTSSADMEDVAASRRNLGAHAVAAGGYEALESPCDSQLTFDDSVAMSANGIYGIKKPSQFNFTGGNPASGNSGNGYSPSNESESVFSDGLPKTNVLTIAAAGGKPSNSSLAPDHLLWLDGQFGEDRAEC